MNASQGEPARRRARVAAGVPEHDAPREDGPQRQRQPEQDTERQVQQIVTVDREQRGDRGDDDGDDGRVPPEDAVQARLDDDDVHDVEPDVREQRPDECEDDTAIAELRAGLHHLRESEHRSLRRVERHEQRSEEDAENARDDRPAQRQAEGGADEADGHREGLEVSDEPEGALVADFPVTFVLGDVVDRAGLDGATEGRGGVAGVI